MTTSTTSKTAQPVGRTRRVSHDPGREREKGWRPTDDDYGADGAVEAAPEIDTDKYERISPKSF